MQKPLTDALILGLVPPASGRIEIADSRCIGLAIRCTAAGAKSFAFRFRPRDGGPSKRLTLGTYPELRLAAARAKADAMRTAVAKGVDPAADRREQRTGGRSFGALATRYLREHADRKKRASSAKADARNLRLHILPKWAKRDYKTIKRGDAITLIEGIIATGKQTLANRVQSLISKIFSFAVDSGLREDHPTARMARRGVERVGERVLSDHEIRAFWHDIGADAPRQAALGLKLTLLTGARIGEIAGLCRSELANIESEASAAWVLPTERTKTRDHLIPLNPMARAVVLELLAGIEPSEQFLIPKLTKPGPLGTNKLWQAMADFAARVDGPARDTWAADNPSPHDLRRTVETRMASIGIAEEIRDRVLNHAPQGTGQKHYNKYDYANEKRHALGRWESLLTTILDGGAVVVALAERRA
jgi:integrase